MIWEHQKTHIMVTYGVESIYTPSPPLLLLSFSLTKQDSKAFILPLLSIQELDSCKDLLRDWVRVRFEGWVESTLWACTCSSQEALEATFDSLIHICYSWSFALRRLEVPVSSHSFVVWALGSLYYPSLCESNSKWLNPPLWLIEGDLELVTARLFVSISMET